MNDTVVVIAIVQSSVSELKGLKLVDKSLQFQYYMLLVVTKTKSVCSYNIFTTSYGGVQLAEKSCKLLERSYFVRLGLYYTSISIIYNNRCSMLILKSWPATRRYIFSIRMIVRSRLGLTPVVPWFMHYMRCRLLELAIDNII